MVKELDRNSIGEVQLKRASDLLQLYHRAAELKKEKCYPVPCEDGKAGKELRLVSFIIISYCDYLRL